MVLVTRSSAGRPDGRDGDGRRGADPGGIADRQHCGAGWPHGAAMDRGRLCWSRGALAFILWVMALQRATPTRPWCAAAMSPAPDRRGPRWPVAARRPAYPQRQRNRQQRRKADGPAQDRQRDRIGIADNITRHRRRGGSKRTRYQGDRDPDCFTHHQLPYQAYPPMPSRDRKLGQFRSRSRCPSPSGSRRSSDLHASALSSHSRTVRNQDSHTIAWLWHFPAPP